VSAPGAKLKDVDEVTPQEARPSQGPQRTAARDGLFYGTRSAAWTALLAIIGHAAGLDPAWWTVGVLGVAVVMIPLSPAWPIFGQVGHQDWPDRTRFRSDRTPFWPDRT
jgi:hypothetical protein